MAFTPLLPTSINANIVATQGQAIQSGIVNNFAGAPVDLSAWVSLEAFAVPSSPNPCTADVSFGTVTAAATGIITLTTNATDLDSVPTGTAKLQIYGKPTSGDISQLLATGTLTLNAP